MQTTLHSFTYALDFLREQVADVSPGDMVAQPNGIVNHPLWVIGHLSHTLEMLGGVIGVPAWLPQECAKRYGAGSVPMADVSAYDSKDAALAALAEAQDRIMRAVQALDDAALDRPFPDSSYLDVFPTIRHAITQVLVGHTAYHVGQIAVWRRAMGLPTMKRSFE